MTDYDQYLSFAHDLADSARDVTLSYFRQPLAIDDKSDGSPVTVADQKTEALLRERISQRYPLHGIVGEEQEEKDAKSEYQWILDPIDGTRSFVTGYPLYGTLICLLKNGVPIVSVIDMPALNERFYATAEADTIYRKRQYEQPVRSSTVTELAHATLFSTDYGMFTAQENEQAQQLRDSVKMQRYNGDCYLYAMLAAGWTDIVLEADLKVYDFLPLTLIVEQAGGVITDWNGKPLTSYSSGQVLAAGNKTLHDKALGCLAASLH